MDLKVVVGSFNAEVGSQEWTPNLSCRLTHAQSLTIFPSDRHNLMNFPMIAFLTCMILSSFVA